MKQIIISTLAIILLFQIGNAQRFNDQDREAMRERIESQRVAFITQKLELSPEEATKFWPLYNEFKKEERSKRSILRPDKAMTDLSDDEARELISSQLNHEAEMVELKREFMNDVMEVISPRRALELNQIETEFNRGVLERLREARRGQGNPRD